MALAFTDNEEEAQTALEAAREFHEKYLLHSEVKDLNLAIDYYIKAVKLNPNMPETYYRLANLLYENGQISLDGAIEQCKAAVKVAPGNADAHLYTGYFMTLAGRYIEANFEFETAIKLDPIGSARARLTLAQSIIKEANIENVGLKNKFKAIYYLATGTLMSAWNMPTIKMIIKNLRENFSVLEFGLKAETYIG
ncbi:tetratricopeptide repeat protein, partial [bacterium]|nr:tetratricopeptide repeat protein [bacterium]